MKRTAPILVLSLLILAVGRTAAQQDETVYVDEVRKDFLERIQTFEEAEDWRGLFEMYKLGLERYKTKQVKQVRTYGSRKVDQWQSVVYFLIERYSNLPKEAHEVYRLEYDGQVLNALNKARETGDTLGLEGLIDTMFFSSHTDEALDFLANRYFQDGRVAEALYFWSQLLKFYPDSELPRELIAARMAIACREANNETALQSLRTICTNKRIELSSKVFHAGHEVTLADLLDGIAFSERSSSGAAQVKMPYLPEPKDILKPRGRGVRNDILRWSYDFKTKTTQPNQPRRGRRIPQPNPATANNDFPIFPAFARRDGREYVVFTNGYRLVAVDPRRATTGSNKGLWWEYPKDGPIKVPKQGNVRYYYQFGSPQVGCTIDNDIVYATLFSTKKINDAGPNNMDSYKGPTVMVAFRLKDGKRLWDTDEILVETREGVKRVLETYDFYDRNWSFSTPPLVRGNRIYIGINTSPMGEQESRVLCLDKKTGKPIWSTFVSSVTGGFQNRWGGVSRYTANLTTLREEGGVLYVQSNLGVVGAINTVSGNIIWLTSYKRSSNRTRGVQSVYYRPANDPLLHRGKLYCLTQDARDMKVFNAATGEPLDDYVEKLRTSGRKEFYWKDVTHILPVDDQWMVLGGTESRIVYFKGDRVKVYPFAGANTSRCGRGALHNGMLYLPTYDDTGGSLALYEQGSWRMLAQEKWKTPGSYGNLLVAGDYLVVATNKVEIYTDIDTLTREFVQRLKQSPKHAPSFLKHGQIMEENGRLPEAADSYLEFINAAEGDPRHTEQINDVRLRLYDIFLQRGLEAASRAKNRAGDARTDLLKDSASHFRRAKGFAYNEKTRTDASLQLAKAYEELKMPKKAVEEYQGILEKSRDAYRSGEEGDQITKAWRFAEERISRLITTYKRDVYEPVEKEAQKALRKIKDTDLDGLRKFIDKFPNSEAAGEAFKKWIGALWKAGRFDKIPAAMEEMKKRYGKKFGIEMWKKLIKSFENMNDGDRLRLVLPAFGEAHGEELILHGEQEITIAEYVEVRLKQLDTAENEAVPPGPLREVATLPSGENRRGSFRATEVLKPLLPLGIRPRFIEGNQELFIRGSSVELWSLGEAPAKMWSVLHPGGWLGIGYTDLGGGYASGVKITEVIEGSPAEKAGLKRNDVIEIFDGWTVDCDRFPIELAKRDPGAEIEMEVKRGSEHQRLKVTLTAHPVDHVPHVVGASFTSDYALAVAWEDAVASIDLRSGRVNWTFRSLRPQFHIANFHSINGRLFVHESYKRGTGRDAYRKFSAEYSKQRGYLDAPDWHSRVICIDDSRGLVEWGRMFYHDVNNGKTDEIEFTSDYMGGWIAFLWKYWKSNVQRSEIRVLKADTGGDSRRQPVNGKLNAWTYEPDRGVMYWVDGAKMLRSMVLEPGAKFTGEKAFEVSLNRKYFTNNYRNCAVIATRDHVALAVLPNGATNAYRVIVFTTQDSKEFKRLTLPEGRTLSNARTDILALDDDGVVYIYNHSESSKNMAKRDAFITAYRLGGPGTEDPLWDAPAPGISPSDTRSPVTFGAIAGHTFFFSTKATMPGERSGGSARGVVFEKKRGGYMVNSWKDLVSRTARSSVGESPLVISGDRVYVSTEKGLVIYED